MSWNYRRLFLFHGIIVLLLLSFFIPFTRMYWQTIDRFFFLLLNNTLRERPNWQIFWACSNHRFADWFHDLSFFIFVICAIFKSSKEKKLETGAQFLFCILYSASIIYFINGVLFREQLRISHPSPTVEYPDSLRLSKEILWMSVKDKCTRSFPGDHGTTALLFASFYSKLATKKLAIFGWIYGVFICLPRMMAGAHWLSDVVVGSGCIALFFFAWAFYSPLAERVTKRLLNFLKLLISYYENKFRKKLSETH